MSIRALIVDDEPLARRRLRHLLGGEPDVEVVGEAGAAGAALAAIERLAPDLLFLDVQMPGLDGFAVLAGAQPVPAVIFVTAHEEHALRAFEVHALDYLLKPFRRERFAEALRRARELLARPRPGPDAQAARLALRDGSAVTFVSAAAIDWIEAGGNYVKIHAGAAEHLLRDTLTGLEARLDPRRFLRIHRRHIVNVARLARVEPGGKNDAVAVLADGTRLPVGRGYRERLAGLLS